VLIVWVAVWAACVSPAEGQNAARYAAPDTVCTLSDKRIVEASGIVASRHTPHVYYVHNDSGGEPRVFVVDRRGRTRAVIVLAGARNVDWEDIALAPGKRAGAFDICVADIGDNAARRAEVVIYRFPEPELPKAIGGKLTVKPHALRLRYPGGSRNAEALVVHPLTGDAYILSKRTDGACRVFRCPKPWRSDRVVELESAGELRRGRAAPIATMVTGADLSRDGRRLVVRTYRCGWEWTLPSGASPRDFAALIRTEPALVELAAEPQGEAICYSAAGDALLTVSEITPTDLNECRVTNVEKPAKP